MRFVLQTSRSFCNHSAYGDDESSVLRMSLVSKIVSLGGGEMGMERLNRIDENSGYIMRTMSDQIERRMAHILEGQQSAMVRSLPNPGCTPSHHPW